MALDLHDFNIDGVLKVCKAIKRLPDSGSYKVSIALVCSSDVVSVILTTDGLSADSIVTPYVVQRPVFPVNRHSLYTMQGISDSVYDWLCGFYRDLYSDSSNRFNDDDNVRVSWRSWFSTFYPDFTPLGSALFV